MKRKTSIDYVTRDYEGFRQLMISLIPSLTPEWTDTSQSDLGMVLLELTAHGLDVLSYYLDKVFNEGTLTTAQTRESVINICNMLGYTLSHQLPATHEIEFTRSRHYYDKRILIPKGTKVGTDPSNGAQIVFETLEDLVFEPISEQVDSVKTVVVSHGETIIDIGVGKTTGKPSESFMLTYPDVLLDTLYVTTQVGGTTTNWDVIDDFFNSTANDRHITASYDAENKMTITFGDGVFGVKPIADSTIYATYRVGGGVIGNVGINKITSFVDKEIAGITVKNPNPPLTVGADVETLDHAKLYAPKAYRAVDRAITKDDFEGIVSSINGVSKAQCIETFNINGDLHIYVVPTSYDIPTLQLKDVIMKKLDEVKLVHDRPILFDPTYIPLNITLDITTNRSYTNLQVQKEVEELIKEVFHIQYMDLGEGLNKATVFREVMRIKGIDNLNVVEPATDVELQNGEILKLATVIVNVTGGV